MEQVTKLLTSFVQEGMTAGASALVLQEGKEVYANAVGYADIGAKTPFRIDSILRIYSMSKIVTSAAVLKLVEEGRLSLTDTADTYLEGFRNQTVAELTEKGRVERCPVVRGVTIHDLLTMTAGIGYLSDGDNARTGMQWSKLYADFRNANKEKPNTVGFANLVGQFPLSSQPGQHWLYGYCCDVLGGIVEVVAGMPFADYLQESFFTPLRMDDTGFTVAKEKRNRIATIYLQENGALCPQPRMLDDMDQMPFSSGGAGLYSTLPDYAKFAQMLLCKGAYKGVRCLQEATVALMTQDHLTQQQKATYNWADCPGYGYGYAVRVMTQSQLSCYAEENGAFGWNGAAGTSVRIDPHRGLVVLFGTQLRPPEHERFLPQLMKAIAQAL